jgi:hypothetical protein
MKELNKTLTILGRTFTLEEFDIKTKMLYMAFGSSESYKQMIEEKSNMLNQISKLINAKDDPRKNIEIARLTKTAQSKAKQLEALIDETEIDAWESVQPRMDTLADEIAQLRKDIDDFTNLEARMLELGKAYDALDRQHKQMDLEFLASLLDDGNELLKASTDEDAVLAHQWVIEGNASLTRINQSLQSLPVNRAQRRAVMKN